MEQEVKRDYKETLNLPKTDFPMKAALAQAEPKWLKFWQDQDIYKSMLQQRAGAKKFIVADGPPYANGDIHIGHALNKILKDIVVKSKHLSGYQTPFIPGWDCHGLPIEHKVEKKVGKPGKKIDAKTFRQKCREYAQSQIVGQRQSFMRLGVFGDWDNYYCTMDYKFEANIIRTLGKIIAQGHLHREDRPVHWCIDCGSALAEAELEYIDKQSHAIDVAFAVVEPTTIRQLFGVQDSDDHITPKGDGCISVVIWTTTPWTLPANQAVTLHAELEYSLVAVEHRQFIVATALLETFIKRITAEQFNADQQEPTYRILGTCLGAKLEQQELKHPFVDRVVPIILGEHVTTDAGTGCVHTAPAHGYDDYVICKKYGIKLENMVAANGCFLPQVAHVGGRPIAEANISLINLMQENNSLLAHKELTHSYPHCWRHKTPLIFRATPQWFISMEQRNLREQALAAIKTVTWVPGWGQARLEAMIKNRPDWCISRQRTWGTPIPLFLHKDTGEMHPNTIELIEQVAIQVELTGIEAWHEIEAADMAKLLGKDAEQYIKSEDTLDVWFDSGAYHTCVADEREELVDPVDIYLEGSDQHRGWFHTSLLSSVAVKQRAPYKMVLTHGFTIDADKRKMSKSLGNTIAPEQVMSTLGADVLRLWVAATDYRGDLHVSEEILKRTSDAYRRIRNTARFLLANLDGFNPAQDMVAFDELLKLDYWILLRASALQAEIIAAYENFQFHLIYQKIHNFCVDELGSFYLDVIKDRQYTGKEDGIPRRSAQTAMYWVIEALTRWIAPILSFTAEEIWQHIPGERAKSVFLTEWLVGLPQGSDEQISITQKAEQYPSDFALRRGDGEAEQQSIRQYVSSEANQQQSRSLKGEGYMGDTFWQQVLQVRTAVNKELESLRSAGVLGSALEAEVELYCDAELFQVLSSLGEELRFVLITSKANVYSAEALGEGNFKATATDLAGLKIVINKSEHEKCARCWHRCSDVSANADYPEVCHRCVENLTVGEHRQYA